VSRASGERFAGKVLQVDDLPRASGGWPRRIEGFDSSSCSRVELSDGDRNGDEGDALLMNLGAAEAPVRWKCPQVRRVNFGLTR